MSSLSPSRDSDEAGTATAKLPAPVASVDPKLFKTTLCQFYLQGPCKNGDTCAFAHGTSELRHPSGKAVKDMEQKTKTKLCDRFLQFGSCSFGSQCSFAHGVRELQKALQAKDVEKSPTFKTQLCKQDPGLDLAISMTPTPYSRPFIRGLLILKALVIDFYNINCPMLLTQDRPFK